MYIKCPLILLISIILNLNFVLSCGKEGNQCDEWSPCCSEHGFCGKGYGFCGIGCQSEYTYIKDNLNYCLLPPACSTQVYKFNDRSRLMNRDNYTGNYKTTDWAVTGQYDIMGDELVIKMPKGSGGGRITSTRYIHFAKVTAKLKTSRGGGVVSSFITMSEDKDEIDFEFIGSALNEAQTNYYSKGVLDLTKGEKHKINNVTNTADVYVDYTIDWTENKLTWLVNGQVVRTLNKQDTLKDGKYNYPVSASRIEIGLWDGGSGEEGTRQWAGGAINWDSNPDYKMLGYIYMKVKEVNVQCYGSPTSSDDDYKLIFEGKTNFTDNGVADDISPDGGNGKTRKNGTNYITSIRMSSSVSTKSYSYLLAVLIIGILFM